MEHKLFVEQLKCPVCKQIFESPKRLPCGHNICLRCLKCHIIRTVPVNGCTIQGYEDGDGSDPDNNPSSQSFKCPVDDEEVNLLYPIDDVSKWANKFENNLSIVTLVEIYRGKPRGLIEMCDNCTEISQNVAAVSVCFTCFEKYCVKCAFIHRNTHPKDLLFNLTAVRNTNTEKSSLLTPAEDSTSKRTCKIHLFCDLNLICMECKDMCCRICQRTIHCDCKHWQKLDTGQNEFETNGILNDRLKKVLEQIASIMKSNLDLLQNVEEMSQSDDTNPNDQFNEMKTELSCQISLWELHYENVQKSLTNLKANTSAEIKTQILYQMEIECQQVEKEIESYSNRRVDNAERLRKFKDALAKSRNKCKKNYRNQCKAANQSDLSRSIKRPQDFKFDPLVHLKTTEIVDVTQKIQLVDVLDMKAADDAKDCWLTDCVFINDMFVLVADNSNMCLKWKKGEEMNKLLLSSGPQCIAVDEQEGNMGCVTLPQDRIVQLFHISTEQISLLDLFETDEKCYGVGFVDSNIAVSFNGEAESSVKILTKEGVELKRFSHHTDILKAKWFRDPRYLTVQRKGNETKIYVTDHRLCHLTCLTLFGQEGGTTIDTIVTHTNGFPLGIDIGADGNLMVCISSKGEVHQIADGCNHGNQQHRLLVQSLWQPRAISCLRQGNKFIVSSDSGPKQNCLLVYEFRSRAC